MFLNANPQGLCKKNTEASEMDESEEAGSELIETGGDPSELLELEEEGFHKMALLVKPPIDVPWIGIILPWRNTKIRVVVGDKLAEIPLAVGPVCENGRALEVDLADQFLGDSNVRGIASGQHDRNGIAQSVYSGVNLGASATAAHSDALIDLGFRPDSIRLLAGGFYGIGGF